jgi:hypothetical protein
LLERVNGRAFEAGIEREIGALKSARDLCRSAVSESDRDLVFAEHRVTSAVGAVMASAAGKLVAEAEARRAAFFGSVSANSPGSSSMKSQKFLSFTRPTKPSTVCIGASDQINVFDFGGRRLSLLPKLLSAYVPHCAVGLKMLRNLVFNATAGIFGIRVGRCVIAGYVKILYGYIWERPRHF